MKKRAIAKKYIVSIAFCSCIAAIRPAAAFIWPTIDISQVGAFVSDVSNGVSQISNTKSQIDNSVQTVNSVGDQATAITKYTADLKGSVTKIGNLNPAELSISENVEKSLLKTNDAAFETYDNNQKTADSTIKNVTSQIEDNAKEEETQSTLNDAKDEILAENQKLNETYKDSNDEVNEIADTTIEQLKSIIPALEQTEELDVEERENFKEEAEILIAKAEKLKKDASETVKETQNKLNSEYNAQIIASFSAYSQSISDYYAGKISKDELSQAGEKFQQEISSLQAGIADSRVKQLVQQAQEVVAAAQKLQEAILNAQSNSREYSDEASASDRLSLNKYIFQHSSKQTTVYTKQIYFNKDIGSKLSNEYQIFGLSSELLCHKMKKDNLKELEKHTDNFRECVTLAKAEKEYICTIKGIPLTDKKCDPYDLEPKKLYKPYRRDGVYDHVVEDYSVANIVNNNRIQQFTASWFEKTYGDLLKVINPEQTSGGEAMIDNARNAYVVMGMVDLEAPKLWSWIRVTDTLQRSKEAVQQFKTGSTLYLDGRDIDFKEASQQKNGLMKNIKITSIEGKNKGTEDRQIFSNVFLYNCDLKADDISMSLLESSASAQEEAEKKIAKCLYKHAAAASGRRPDPTDKYSTYCGSNITLEQCSTIWREKEIKAINDSLFQTLALATINNYKSSKDYLNRKDLPKDEINIASLQEDMKKNSTARDEYATGAEINYYSTMQILSIVDADAQNLQTEILKYLTELDYNFFDESFNEEN